jgi:hypothetical protein
MEKFKSLIIKSLIIAIIVTITYHLTLGRQIYKIYQNFNYNYILENQDKKTQIKSMIFKEIEKLSEKEKIFNEKEKEIILKIIKKIQSELK